MIVILVGVIIIVYSWWYVIAFGIDVNTSEEGTDVARSCEACRMSSLLFDVGRAGIDFAMIYFVQSVKLAFDGVPNLSKSDQSLDGKQ